MPEKIIHRIQQIMDHYDLSKNAFDNRLGLGNNYIGSMIRREGNPGSDLIEKIVREWPEIDARWIVIGEGNMLLEQKKEEDHSVKPNIMEHGGAYSNDLFEKTLSQYLNKPKIQEQINKLIDDRMKKE